MARGNRARGTLIEVLLAFPTPFSTVLAHKVGVPTRWLGGKMGELLVNQPHVVHPKRVAGRTDVCAAVAGGELEDHMRWGVRSVAPSYFGYGYAFAFAVEGEAGTFALD